MMKSTMRKKAVVSIMMRMKKKVKVAMMKKAVGLMKRLKR
jgi:hypothetical protein